MLPDRIHFNQYLRGPCVYANTSWKSDDITAVSPCNDNEYTVWNSSVLRWFIGTKHTNCFESATFCDHPVIWEHTVVQRRVKTFDWLNQQYNWNFRYHIASHATCHIRHKTKDNFSQKEIREISRRRSCSSKYPELVRFTLLFSRGRLRNLQRLKVHVHSHCSAHWTFCFVAYSLP